MEHVLLRIYFAVQRKFFAEVDKETFEKIIRQGTILEEDKWGVKVVETDSNNIVKIFRLKRVFSSALLLPYAWQFKNNARKLQKQGIDTIEVTKIEYCLPKRRHLVTYKKIRGKTIRELLNNDNKNSALINQTIEFVVNLHQKGIYFRSLHFGNIVVSETGRMALIDIADLNVYPWPLALSQRIRNWNHLLKYSFEKQAINNFGYDLFFDKYSSAAGLSQRQKSTLKKKLIEFL